MALLDLRARQERIALQHDQLTQLFHPFLRDKMSACVLAFTLPPYVHQSYVPTPYNSSSAFPFPSNRRSTIIHDQYKM